MDSNSREILYLLSVELIVFYLFGFGFLMLRADTNGFGGIGYSAVLYTFLAAYLLDILAWIVLGLKNEIETVIAIATGGVIFSTVAFLTLLLLCVMLWSNPLVCIDVSATQTLGIPKYQCFRKGDSVRQVASDVKFSFPSPEKYDDYRELANASVADIFMKAKISESDFVTKFNAIFFVPLVFLIYILQNSFFNAIYSGRRKSNDRTPPPTEQSEVPTEKKRVIGFGDLGILFLRCALLVLSVVMDMVDFFPAWNVHDGYLQMTPSLLVFLVFFLTEFTYLIPYEKIMAVVGLVSSVVYMIISILVTLYYAYPQYVPETHAALQLDSVYHLSDVTAAIVDTRPSLLIVLFIFFLIADNLFVLRASLKRVLGLFTFAREEEEAKAQVSDITHETSKPFDVKKEPDATVEHKKEEPEPPSPPKSTFRFDALLRTQDNPAVIDFRAISKKKS